MAIVFDRYPLILDAVETSLRRCGVMIAATTTTHQEALELLEEHDPDLLVAGIEGSREAEGVIGLVREAMAARPDLKVIVLSSSGDTDVVHEVFEAGAAAFIGQNGSQDDIEFAIRQTYEQSIYFASRGTPITAWTSSKSAPTLTKRELEILRLVYRGLSNAEVGRALRVTEQTVKFHLSQVFRKLDVSNRTGASYRARQLNLFRDEEPDVEASATMQ